MAYQIFDRSEVKSLPLSQRENKTMIEYIYHLGDDIPEYKNPDLKVLAKKIITARKKKKPVIWMMGAHLIRRGNSRFIIDLMERGFITHIAANGACAIHDFEFAYQGATCEDVEEYIKDGRFGNWEETAFFINTAVADGYHEGNGYGESIGKMIETEKSRKVDVKFLHRELSVFAAAYRLGIPITIHKGIGFDITDQHSSADYAALGGASGRDFLFFADAISKLEGGGVYLNIGTQVMGPEVYLKALSMARNIAAQQKKKIRKFTTAVFDLVDLGDWKKEDCDWKKQDSNLDPGYYFRPKKTILIRTIKDGGESFYIQGDFRDTIPNLYHHIIKTGAKG